MSAEIIDFASVKAGIQDKWGAQKTESAMARAREPEYLTPSERETVLHFVMALKPEAIARWITMHATDAGLALLTG